MTEALLEAFATAAQLVRPAAGERILLSGNSFFGGRIRIPRHRDFIVENPKVEADSEQFAQGGKWTCVGGNE